MIGTCSSNEKADVLKSLGCNRPINYNEEDVYQVLKKEYPKGIDVIYESVGGQMFETCVRNLAVRGRLIVIGMITQYQESVFRGSIKTSTLADSSVQVSQHQRLLPANTLSRSWHLP